MPETLRQKRCRFTRDLAALINHAIFLGYEVAINEAYRPPAMARINADLGKGTMNSLHIDGLAADLNLYKDGKYLDKTEDHRALGEWWEMLGKDYRWGGRFKRPDGNHYSITPDGVRA